VKIAFIGGGSYAWGPPLLGDLALSGKLDGTICLTDHHAEAGERLQHLGQRYMASRQAPLDVTFTPVLDEALDGANYVLLSITTGGLEAMRGDLEIPEGYGIFQTVGDTVGPGGIARGLRNIPVILEIAHRMEQRCPGAWLVNVTNPMTMLCRAVTKATSVPVIGLCHEVRGVQGVARTLLEGTGGSIEDWQVAGVNHFPWLVKADAGMLARLRERVAALPPPAPYSDPFLDNLRVKMDLLDTYGTFPVAGDRHVAEFFPQYLRQPAEAFERYGVILTKIHHREAHRALYVEAVLRQLDGRDPISLFHSGEQAVPVIEALSGRGDGTFVVNIPNRGQLHAIPDGAVVECMATVDAQGVHPHETPDLPAGVLPWVQTHVAAQELVVRAALEQRSDLALQGLLLDPLSHGLRKEEARSMLRTLEAHNARFV
jgi:alpha-galactosidase